MTFASLKAKSKDKTVLSKKLFIELMKEFWVSHDNEITDKVIAAWGTIYQCFEDQLSIGKGMHVSDSVCGTGKTLAVQAACTVLGKTQPTVGGLIVTRFKEEANKIANRINSLFDEEVAFAYHSDLSYMKRKNTGYLKNYQFLIVTHTSYLASLSDLEKRGAFRSWKHGLRSFRVVDESLDLLERHSITKKDIQDFLRNLNRINDLFLIKNKYPSQFKVIDDVQMFLHTAQANKEAYLYSTVLENYGDDIFLTPMWENDINKIDNKEFDLRDIKSSDPSKEIKNKLFEFCSLFDRVIRQEIWLSHNKHGQLKASIGELILPDSFDSLCILDATSNLDKIYSLFEDLDETFERYSVPRSVRNFANANLHIMPTPITNIGKRSTSTDHAMVARFPRLVSWAKKTFSPEDKVLFVTHNDQHEKMMTYFKKSKFKFEFDIAHWQKIDGRNDWEQYNKLVVTTLPYLPTDYSPTTLLAFKTRMPDSIDINGDDSIASASIAVKIVQLLCRIRIRKVMDNVGNCPSADIYLPLESQETTASTNFKTRLKKRGRYLLDCIESSLNGIKTDEWTSFSWNAKAQTKDDDSALSSRFIEWINHLKPGQSFNYKEFKATLSPKEVNNLKVQFNEESSLVSKHLADSKIIRESKRGSGTFFYYQ